MSNHNFFKSIIYIFIAFTLLFTACKSDNNTSNLGDIPEVDARFAAHISAFTSGIISVKSTIKIRLNEASPYFAGENVVAPEQLFAFEPSIKGEAYWIDAQTIEFRPTDLLKSGQLYKAQFLLEKVKEVESDFKKFTFGFQTIVQAFDVEEHGLIIENPKNEDVYVYEGVLSTADYVPSEKLDELLIARYEGDKVKLKWTSSNNNHQHIFRTEALKRGTEKRKLELSWDGAVINAKSKSSNVVSIPEKGAFYYLNHRTVSQDGEAIFVYFSDVLDAKQDLRGVIDSKQINNMRFSVESNLLKIYFTSSNHADRSLTVLTSLLNAKGQKLKEEVKINTVYVSMKPNIRQVGKGGTILPSSKGLIYPFEAVNLNAVHLSVIKVFENNIIQFLQTNQLDGNYEMKRVGRPVLRKTIPLTNAGVADLNKWNRFTLDLNDFIKAEPGAIYQVNISFSRRHINYGCGENTTDQNLIGFEEEEHQKEDELYAGPGYYYYDYYDYDDYYYEDDYNWNERDNPCNPAYYSSNKMIRQNIFASDLGLIAKSSNNGHVTVAVSNILSVKPMSGVTLEIYDFQQQLIAKGESNSEGIATIKVPRTPFLLIAKQGSERGYLRLDDQSALSLSNFDVTGAEIKKGLKGFIYGERGVWRPGDSLHLAFILEDKLEVLPMGHPMVFELKNPEGQVVSRTLKAYDKTGIYTFPTVTDAEAPTGNWLAVVKVGGASFSKRIKIESIKPNRLKINLTVDKDAFNYNTVIKSDLHAKWLHGATAGGLKAEYEVLFSKTKTTFKGMHLFTFDDPGVSAPDETFEVFDGKLDSEGHASIHKNLPLNTSLPSSMNAHFRGKVFEPGGDFSVDFLTVPLMPYASYVGLQVPEPSKGRWLETGRNHTVELRTVDSKGNNTSENNLKVQVFKMNWSWWWQQEQNGAAYYVNSSYVQPVFSTRASTSSGKGTFDLQVNDADWGRYYVRVINEKTGQSCGKIIYMDWPSSYGRTKSDMPGGAAMLALSADKDEANVGEKVTLTLPGAPGARAYISIEGGAHVINSYWVDAADEQSTVAVNITPEMAPNVYINVTLVQPHSKKNDLPIRRYAIHPVAVVDPNTRLSPIVETDEFFRPNKECKITVAEKDGRAMTYTVAVVDEGLLDLTRFQTPNPWPEFYAKQAIGVKSFDLYDAIIGAYGGELERLLAVGGDEALKVDDDGKNVRFKPVVKVMGPFVLPKGKKVTHRFKMPNYVGSVRTMVVAAYEGAYGAGDATTPVKEDLMVLGTLPRVLGPSEEVALPVNIFALSDRLTNVSVKIKTSDLFEIEGNSQQNISFSKQGDQMVFFKLKTKSAVGNAKVEIVAESGGVKATQTIDIEIRHPNTLTTATLDTMLAAGQTWNHDFKALGVMGTNSGGVELSTVPSINLSERLNYLIRYPHGCVEQTTSGAFPQLYLHKLVQLEPERITKVEHNIKSAIQRLMTFQDAEGGFQYWPGSRSIDDWSTSYVGHFLVEAKKAGYTVPEQMLSKWISYQQSAARKWYSDTRYRRGELTQAYRLYTLALAGSPEIGAMNKLFEVNNRDAASSWRLATAYALAGKQDIAAKLVTDLPERIPEYRELSYTFGSSTRDRAMILEALIQLGKTPQAAQAVRDLAQKLNSKQWLSTQETAYALIAIARFYEVHGDNKGVNAQVTINGTTQKASTDKSLLDQEFAVKETGVNSLKLENKSQGQLFVKLYRTGIPAVGQETASNSNLEMKVHYRDVAGNAIDVTELTHGKEFIAEVSFKNPGYMGEYKEMALSQVFPSGWEIRNTRMEENDNRLGGSVADYQDYRDDRVLTYFNLKPGETKKFVIMLTATYRGKFYLPGPYCEAMYDNSINAKEKGMWVRVK